MTLTTSSNNYIKEWKKTYLWSLKKNRGMMALLALLLFMAMPMILMIWMSSHDVSSNNYSNQTLNEYFIRYLSAVIPFLVTPLILIFVVVIAVSLFSYMHQKRSVDLFHALPIGRVPMLLGRYFAGLTTLFLPILLNFSIVLIVGAVHQVSIEKYLSTVISYMLWLILMSTAALTFCVFMAVCTGTTLDMVLSILGVNAAYPLLIFLGSTFASLLLPGLSIIPAVNSTVLSALSPFMAAFMPYSGNGSYLSVNDGLATNGPSGVFLAWWIVFTLILLAGSILLYKKRKSECAESNFAFPLPKIVIRFMITAVVGLGLGLVLHMSTNNPANFFIGVVSGSLAAHIVVEAIYSRGFKQLKKSFVYYGIFAVAFIAAYAVLAVGCFGFDTRMPNAEDVASIDVSSPSISYQGDNSIYNENHLKITEVIPTLKEKSNIEKVVSLHQKFVTDMRNKAYPYCVEKNSGPNFTITYNLKNGKTIKRTYSVYYTDTNSYTPSVNDNDLINSITELKEYRENGSLLFYLEPEYIKSVDLNINSKDKNTNNNEERLTFAPDLNTKKELLESLKQDYLDGKIINGKNLDDNTIYLVIECKDPIELKDGRLKTFLNDYNGKITLGTGSYDLGSGTSRTRELIEKLGWNK